MPSCCRKEWRTARAFAAAAQKNGAADVGRGAEKDSKRVSRERTEGVGEMPEHQVRRLTAGMRFVACFFDFMIVPHADDREA
jgi:hypothetical protein